MKQTTIPAFKYWLRIHGFRLERFGAGTKTIQSRLNQEKEIRYETDSRRSSPHSLE